ncbi:putative undecaprenyl-phosphate N-acetylglucosaminyl 1-phosphate transferase [Peribacillus simplex]|uniref:MraY family glycosyltransferase n=1 Tax=Peribacillus simplex TaxID=1478 RepID=UPI001DAFB460|nr:MraY family glycosyltransferase [Peribacillus simplex]CAH0132856.1 putative undecaprenyl-phosphate N-acetylglucosaminyl 1-phosphate transferase [Peribacillus simplex]
MSFLMLIGALLVSLLVSFLLSIFLTPFVGKLAFKLGATDKPNERKVHSKVMPRMGGLAIFLSFFITFLLFMNDFWEQLPLDFWEQLPLLVGALVIILIGMADDIFELRAAPKFLGQVLAALIIVLWGGLEVKFINLPFFIDTLEFGVLSIPITILWIVSIINAINLIDGLDGLAGGVSTIALVTIATMALIKGDLFVAMVALIVIGSTLGFLKYNFHPAKIFMGDTGALFLGYIIAVLSLQGFKNVTMISLIVPIIILGVPISDTFFAIIRRVVNKQPISAADKSHLHHCLINLGFTHKQTVLLIYALAACFGLAAIIFQFATVWGALILVTGLLLIIEIFVEKIGLVNSNYQPLLKMLNFKNKP